MDRTAMIAHDTRLGQLWMEEAHAAARLANLRRTLAAKHTTASGREYAEREMPEAQDKANAAAEATAAHEANYAGWARFWLVNNTDGHIHRRTTCSTLRWDTRISLLPTLSGTDEATAVAEQGEILCSVCFPDAPVAWTNGVSKATQAERAERDAAKAEREAKKEAKRLVPGSDEGITVQQNRMFPQKVKTVASAKSFLTDGYDWGWDRHPDYSGADRDLIAAALLGRPGVKETTVEEILAAAAKRAANRK